jgi:heme oxygenase (mycobilin-producing)
VYFHGAVVHEEEAHTAPFSATKGDTAPSEQRCGEKTGARRGGELPADRALSAGAPLFVALSKFTVANGLVAQVHQAFLQRPHLVDTAPGFVRLEVLSPLDNPEEVWLLTYWRDESSYRAWHRSHAYHASHAGIPKGLKLVPHSAQIRCFTQLCS